MDALQLDKGLLPLHYHFPHSLFQQSVKNVKLDTKIEEQIVSTQISLKFKKKEKQILQ